MKQSFTAALLAVFAGAVMPTVVSAAEAMASGTFTEEQFERGQVLYERECASCHGANLEGGVAPILASVTFRKSYSMQGANVAELYNRIRNTMPPPPA